MQEYRLQESARLMFNSGMKEKIEYTYYPKPIILGACALFFAVCGWVMMQKALHNDRGVVINRLIELDAQGATIFYWVLVLLSAGFVVLGIAGFIKGMSGQRVVSLNAYDITAPKHIFAPNDTSILYQDIRDLQRIALNGQVTFIIHHAGGRLSLSRMMFASKDAFEDFSENLAGRVHEARKLQG